MVYLFFGLTIISAILTGCFVTDLGHCVQAGDNDPNIRPAAIGFLVTIALAGMTLYMIFSLSCTLQTGARVLCHVMGAI